MKLLRSRLLAVILTATFPMPVSAADKLVEQFFSSCVDTLPDFSTIGETLDGTEYQPKGDGWWTGGPELSSFNVSEEPDRMVCLMAVTGNHVVRFSEALRNKLDAEYAGKFEQQLYEGRTLYLVSTARGLTILEVIPPLGASTFLVANARLGP